ncbi:hypothetical protein BSKO_09220 [Bryopsis sp. KO-2023]|nr:hypothetical protein BSKO_09220 [Bryopsis sp. KO-2023]
MPSEISSSAKRLRRSESYTVVTQANGERFVWNRENEKGYFLREDLWPRCVLEERSIHPWHAQPAVAPTEVDRVLVRYVRQKTMWDTSLRKSGRGGRRRSPWLAALMESAKELDFLTSILVHTVQRSRSEELIASLEGLPSVTEAWSFCKNPDSTRALRCAWRCAHKSLNNDLVIIYTSPDHDYRWIQLLFRSELSKEGYQDLEEMDVFYGTKLIEGKNWETVSSDWGMEELDTMPYNDRQSPHCVALVSEVILAHRRERFANVLSLARSAVAGERLLLEERDALREEVAIYRRQLTTSSVKSRQLPHYVDAIWSYLVLVQQVKALYFRFKDVDSDDPNDLASRQDLFSNFVCGTLAMMEDVMVNRHKDLLKNALAALGNLETPEHLSRSTRDGFDVYCRMHWRDLFLTQLDANNDAASVSESRCKLEAFISTFNSGATDLTGLLDAVFNRLWEVTVVMFLQRPQLRFSLIEGESKGVFFRENYEFVEGMGEVGDDLVVIVPPVSKRSVCEESGSVVWEVVEKGCIDRRGG